jgi:hypothetical protein
MPETDTGMNVFGKLDERNGQFVEGIVVELARRVESWGVRGSPCLALAAANLP